MRILVTGGLGFIGYHLVKALNQKGYKVFVYDAKTASAINAGHVEKLIGRHNVFLGSVSSQVQTKAVMQAVSPDIVFHLAAQSHVDASIKDPYSSFMTNTVGTQVVAGLCAAMKVPLVYTSTDEVYGDTIHANRASWETDLCHPSSPYSASKLGGEHAVEATCRTQGLCAAITRGCNAFGTHQGFDKVIPIFLRRIKEGREIPIHGSGLQVRQWIDVEEMAQGIFMTGLGLLGKPDPKRCFWVNIAGPTSCSILELANEFQVILGKKVGVTHIGDRPGQDMRYLIEQNFGLKSTGWSPSISVLGYQTVTRLYDHYGASI